MYGLGTFTTAQIQAFAGQLVKFTTATIQAQSAMFQTADVNATAGTVKFTMMTVPTGAGTPSVVTDAHGNPVTTTVNVADIQTISLLTAIAPARTGTVQAGLAPGWWILIAGGGAFVLYRLGFFNFLGFSPAGQSAAPARRRSKHKKRK